MSLHKTLLLPDMHVPLHDERAVKLVLKVAKAIKPQRLISVGDMFDMLSMSQHDSPTDKKTMLQEEVYEGNKMLDRLDSLGCKDKVLILGNHEDRLARYLVKHAPTLFDSLTIEGLFHLKERGWKTVPYRSHVTYGKISYIHDTGGAGAYAAQRSGAVFESSVVQGHTHRLTQSYFGNAHGETHTAVSLGWLGSKEAATYMHPISVTRNWQKGFGLSYQEPGGNTHVQTVPIVEYRCCVEGKLFSA